MEEKVKIEYSIVSRGTEKYNNCGYMSISEKTNSYRYILNIDHGIKESNINNECLKFQSNYEIENMALSRFQLIIALMYKKHKKEIKDNILILGLGNIGISCLLYLLDKKYSNITIYVRKITDYLKNGITIIENCYNVKIKIITLLDDVIRYETFIDTTGSSNVLKILFNNMDNNKTIVILSTPRDNTFSISPLVINRKNLTIIGGHELNGIDKNYRNREYSKLLEENKDKDYLKQFVNIYCYSSKRLKEIIKQKNNFIEVFKC